MSARACTLVTILPAHVVAEAKVSHFTMWVGIVELDRYIVWVKFLHSYSFREVFVMERALAFHHKNVPSICLTFSSLGILV